MEVGVGEQVVEMFGDLVVIGRGAEESTLAVDDLEGDTSGSGGDNWNTSVEGFGNLDLETFTSGKLKSNVGVIQKRVQDCTGVSIKMSSGVLTTFDSR